MSDGRVARRQSRAARRLLGVRRRRRSSSALPKKTSAPQPQDHPRVDRGRGRAIQDEDGPSLPPTPPPTAMNVTTTHAPIHRTQGTDGSALSAFTIVGLCVTRMLGSLSYTIVEKKCVKRFYNSNFGRDQPGDGDNEGVEVLPLRSPLMENLERPGTITAANAGR